MTPPYFMYDGAYSPDLLLCRKRGAIAMSHYVTRSYRTTSADPVATRKAGMGAVFNWEGMAAELKGATRVQGRQIGEEALGALPSNAPRNGSLKLYYSVDTDLTDLTVCDEAFRGIRDAHQGSGVRVGVYGEGGLIIRLCHMGLVDGKQWLSMSEGFGGFHAALDAQLVAVVQMHNAAGQWIDTDIKGTDRNTVIDPHDLGAWWPDPSPFNPPAPAPVSLLEELMALDPNSPDYKRLVSDVADAVWAKQLTFASGTKNAITANAAIWLMYSNRYALGGLSRMAQAFKQAVTK